MIFITHYCFRHVRERDAAPPLRFCMRGFPVTTLLGATLMAAVLLTTAFTDEFGLTRAFGLPFLATLAAIDWLRYRQAPRATPSSGEAV